MNWDALGAFAELIGAIAVVATLLYLSIQLRQNTKTVRISATQAVTEELQDMFSQLSSDHSLAEILVEAGENENLDGANRVRYYTFTSNLLRVYENAFLQKEQGVMDDAHWDGMTRMMIDYTKMPAFSVYWEDRKHWLSEGFQNYMENVIISAPLQPGVNIPGNYQH